MGPFHKRQKNIILCDSKRSITDFFELQFDTPTLLDLQNDRLEVASRGSNLIYYVITWYLIGSICNTNTTVLQSSVTRPTAAVLMT